MTGLAMVLALGLEAALGWPDGLYRRIGHPVTWIGALVSRLDTDWNNESDPPLRRRQAGIWAALSVIGICGCAALAVTYLLPDGPVGFGLLILIAAPWFATRSLYDHVRAVALPLAEGDVSMARSMVARIVGRDPEALDSAGIARATLESLGENASDGIVAPLFWGVVLGLPGLVIYKAINTMDSMIGYRSPRHSDFGRFAARLDDVVNWLPARLTALAFALVSGRVIAVLRVTIADAPQHRSPNGGWPEAALAGALGCRLSGPRSYGAGIEQQPWVNAGAPDPDAETLARGLRTYLRMVALVAGIAILAGAIWGA